MAKEERFPATVSVSLLLTHGRSNRLFLTRHGVEAGQKESWGLIAGGVKEGESPWDAAMREAKEEANIEAKNIIFVRGRNSLEPHVALIRGKEKDSVGLVFEATYSGPKVPMSGWEIEGDNSVDRVELFSWQRVLGLLDDESQIYRPEFNYPQLIRWTLKNGGSDERRKGIINRWLLDKYESIPGLIRREVSGSWDYIPPYNEWMGMPGIRGIPSRTNFARERFLKRIV